MIQCLLLFATMSATSAAQDGAPPVPASAVEPISAILNAFRTHSLVARCTPIPNTCQRNDRQPAGEHSGHQRLHRRITDLDAGLR
jgi:hypothetical protein